MKTVDFEFDKEMDSLLRQAARGETVSAAQNPKSQIPNLRSVHLDADEISAFAENALAAKMRTRAVEHLADCARCRTILSGLISLNGETQSETIHASETIRPVAAPARPWYKRFFSFPQITYAMSALALLFAAVVGFVVLRSGDGAQNSSVAQIEKTVTSERPLNGKGASSDGETASSETFSSNATAANTSANSNAATIGETANPNGSSPRAANSNASSARADATRAATSGTEPTAAKPAAPVSPPAPQPREEAAVTATAPSENRVQDNAADNAGARQAERSRSDAQNTYPLNQQNIAPDSRAVQRSAPQRQQQGNLPLTARSSREARVQEQESAETQGKTEKAGRAAAKSARPAETRTVRGKNFRRADGVWYDATYRNQPTTNVRRETEQYNSLDSRLRRIAEDLGGAIVVVWGGRAYRIE